MQLLIAPDKFKHALDAAAAAAALAAGIRDALPAARIDLCPLSDGGDGAGPILAAARGLTERSIPAHDALFRERGAPWWRASDGGCAVIEAARVIGLSQVPEAQRDPLHATSYGVGELISAAGAAGCAEIDVCLGGTATVDGGAGCLQALGWRLLDAAGRELQPGCTPHRLRQVRSILAPQVAPAFRVRALCDVYAPLLGPAGAARTFAPQKGATPAAVELLEDALAHWCAVFPHGLHSGAATAPGAGAAGGLGFALHAALAAPLLSGADEILCAVHFARRLRGCDVCLTGEGRLDGQTALGKLPARVAALAAAAGVPVVAFVGAAQPAAGEPLAALAQRCGLAAVRPITPAGTPQPQALTDTAANLRRAAREWAQGWAAGANC